MIITIVNYKRYMFIFDSWSVLGIKLARLFIFECVDVCLLLLFHFQDFNTIHKVSNDRQDASVNAKKSMTIVCLFEIIYVMPYISIQQLIKCCSCRGGANYDHNDKLLATLVVGHKIMPHAKYLSSNLYTS